MNKQRGWALGGSNKERVRTAIEEAVKISNLMNKYENDYEG